MENSDMQQKFEAWAKMEIGKYPSLYDLPEAFRIGPEDSYFEDAVAFSWAAYQEAYAEGMREGQQSTKTFVIDLLDKRMRKMLQVDAEDGPGSADIARAECFHLAEIQRILKGETTCGVYDDYGALPLSTEGKG